MTNENIAQTFALVGDWVTIPEIAQALDLKVTRVHNLISDGTRVLESLKGTLAVLKDSGFSDEEAITWLYTNDESLPGRPIDALIDGRKTEIRRRAQALAW